jgi:hypothetical protein
MPLQNIVVELTPLQKAKLNELKMYMSLGYDDKRIADIDTGDSKMSHTILDIALLRFNELGSKQNCEWGYVDLLEGVMDIYQDVIYVSIDLSQAYPDKFNEERAGIAARKIFYQNLLGLFDGRNAYNEEKLLSPDKLEEFIEDAELKRKEPLSKRTVLNEFAESVRDSFRQLFELKLNLRWLDYLEEESYKALNSNPAGAAPSNPAGASARALKGSEINLFPK